MVGHFLSPFSEILLATAIQSVFLMLLQPWLVACQQNSGGHVLTLAWAVTNMHCNRLKWMKEQGLFCMMVGQPLDLGEEMPAEGCHSLLSSLRPFSCQHSPTNFPTGSLTITVTVVCTHLLLSIFLSVVLPIHLFLQPPVSACEDLWLYYNRSHSNRHWAGTTEDVFT